MALTNKERSHLERMRERCIVLRARVSDSGGGRPNYIVDWERELRALEWAISKLDNDGQPSMTDRR
jgi:hypothetical protein